MSGEDILVTERLGKSFGGFAAVSDVNLKVRRGSIHALIGPNGAGKTTCFNMLTKFVAPSFGRILFNGRDITAYAAGRRRPPRPGALVPDLGDLPPPDRARERARSRCSAIAATASTSGARRRR